MGSMATITNYHTDHVGSLLRPPELLAARAEYASGKIALEALRAVEDRAIVDVLDMQRQVGIDVFRGAVEGFVPRKRIMPAMWKGPSAEIATRELENSASFAVGGKIRLNGRFTGDEAQFLKRHAKTRFKITMPGPATFQHFYEPGFSETAYANREAMLADIIKIYEKEIDALVEDGVPVIQIDSLRYGDAIDAGRRKRWEERGVDIMQVIDETLKADNEVLAHARKAGIVRAMHICRGNHRSAWAGEGAYDAVADKLFGGLDVDRFLLEFDDERSGSFAPLRFVPNGKTVVLGLITTKSGQLEDPDMLRRRIDEAAKVVPLEYLAISPQCGFASTELGNLLSRDEQRRKLELVVDTARNVWG